MEGNKIGTILSWIFLAFIVAFPMLKILGIINVSWVIALLPFVLWFIVVIFLFTIVGIIVIATEMNKRKGC